MPALKGQVSNPKASKGRRSALRRKLTPAEAALWTLLKDKSLQNLKFRRQHGVGPYILDFYCPSIKLCIELDGEGHFIQEGLESDQRRDRYLASLGIKVVRFENESVFHATGQVLIAILKVALERTEPPRPSGTPP